LTAETVIGPLEDPADYQAATRRPPSGANCAWPRRENAADVDQNFILRLDVVYFTP